MQQLIDKQVLLQALKKKRYSKQSLDLIESQPVVDAIPVDWINEWGEQFYRVISGIKHYMGDGYDSIWDMLEDWEKENETI